MTDRKEIENRILNIISHIDEDKTLEPLYWNLELFSLDELLELKDFLETWEYDSMYSLLSKEIKEYSSIVKEIEQVKIWEKMLKVKDKEYQEKIKETEELNWKLIF